ncbi:MAG: Unknown protein [uncultured Campylobacterales bacterium]|uniref:bAvd-like domain-containing protein n=1 Tax=uncultured Campylobacterales bacterium TaxID=352960 RepID=A0A6S6SH93_9BACT|nr:MAG: Unknown protein [uncultured Campylobacterales bacterium]
MINYNKIPIYKPSYELLTYFFVVLKNMKKEFKYSLCEDIRKNCFELLKNINKASIKREGKKEILEDAKVSLEYIQLGIRLLNDIKEIKLKQFLHIQKLIIDIDEQLNKWYNSIS